MRIPLALLFLIASNPGLATESSVKSAASSVQSESENSVQFVPPEQALQWLKNGNTRFTKGKKGLRNDGQSSEDRLRLTSGQKPHTIVVSCSDSRVPPEVVFDQKLGEIFVVRSAGQSLDSAGIASIEYAVEHLGSRLLVVLGHESCGAVKAALATPPGQSAGSRHLDYLVNDIRPRIQGVVRQPASRNVITESTMNARGVAQDLVKRSEIVKKAVTENKLEIRSAIYYLNTGFVDFF